MKKKEKKELMKCISKLLDSDRVNIRIINKLNIYDIRTREGSTIEPSSRGRILIIETGYPELNIGKVFIHHRRVFAF